MKIYFAASIRGGRKDIELYAGIIQLLQKYGTVLTEHIGDPNLSDRGEYEHSDEIIFERDIRLLNECDVIIAEVTTASLGVGYEIGRMENQKPILCLFREKEGKRLSAMLGGNGNLDIKKYEKLEDIEKLLKDFLK